MRGIQIPFGTIFLRTNLEAKLRSLSGELRKLAMLTLPIDIDGFTSSDGYVTEDMIDKLNSQATAYLLFFLAMLTGVKQTFGTPLQCMAPAESVDSWVDYYHDYCFVQNDLKLDLDSRGVVNPAFINRDPLDDRDWPAKPVYYQWVPYILFVQAVLFLLPRQFWKIAGTNLCYGTDIECVVTEAASIQKTTSGEYRVKAAKVLADFIYETLDLRGRKRRSRYTLTVFYVIRKWLMFLNVLLQFLMLTNLISVSDEIVDFLWGYKLLEQAINPTGNATANNHFFPNMIRCNVTRFTVGNKQTDSIQCMLMMNFINAKIFLLLYFWLIILAFTDFLAAIHCTLLLTLPFYRNHAARSLLPSHETLMEGASAELGWMRKHVEGRRVFNYFLKVLGTDGVLMLMFVYNHAGGMITAELAQHLWNNAFPSSLFKENPRVFKSDRRGPASAPLLDDKLSKIKQGIFDENVKKLEQLLTPEAVEPKTRI